MSDPRIFEALARLPDYLGSHVLVSVTALAAGLAVSLPLALLARHRPLLRTVLLGATSIVQTIPGLALLALFYPLLLGVAAISERFLDFTFSALGFLPAVLALALYSMLPVVRNTITGLEGIDPAIKQAAVGVGMTEGQSLRLVELPLALPFIMAGIRTASVWVIGTATLATPIGQTSLGNYIFTGLQTQNWVFVLFGCFFAAALALIFDLLLALIAQGLAERGKIKVAAGAAAIACIVLASLVPGAMAAKRDYVIGSKTFAEQYILANLIRDRLAAAGLSARRRDGLGSAVIFDALAAGDIDVYVDYSGTIWANQMHHTKTASRSEVLSEVGRWVEATHGIKMLGSLGFENAYGLAMLKKRADAFDISSIETLAREAPRLTIAGDYEFFGRPEWRAIRSSYGLAFRERKQMQSDLMYQAVAAGDVDVISAFTSDGRIAQFGLKVLDDPHHIIPPYDAILLISPRRSDDEAFLAALKPLIGAIDVAAMREANRRVSNGASPAAGAQWLSTHLDVPGQSLAGSER
jgi:osmoprotectant transport system permease protein